MEAAAEQADVNGRPFGQPVITPTVRLTRQTAHEAPSRFKRPIDIALEVEASSYAKLVDKAKARFDLSPACDRVDGLDEIFQEFTQGKLRVGLEWDNWTCFTIVAKSPASEGLAEDIARFLALCLPAT